WIGGQDQTQNGEYVWSTNPSVSIARNMWSYEEPNDWNGEDCVQIAKDGFLNDFSCTSVLYFVCQL
ncbi:C-type lectin domain family 17 member A, partial [Biomphalaria pfeifferi]